MHVLGTRVRLGSPHVPRVQIRVHGTEPVFPAWVLLPLSCWKPPYCSRRCINKEKEVGLQVWLCHLIRKPRRGCEDPWVLEGRSRWANNELSTFIGTWSSVPCALFCPLCLEVTLGGGGGRGWGMRQFQQELLLALGPRVVGRRGKGEERGGRGEEGEGRRGGGERKGEDGGERWGEGRREGEEQLGSSHKRWSPEKSHGGRGKQALRAAFRRG